MPQSSESPVNYSSQAARDWRSVVVKCLRTMIAAESDMPADDSDWIASGLLDSMALVEVLECLENSAQQPGLFDRLPGGPPRTIRAAAECLAQAKSLTQERSAGAAEQSGFGVPVTVEIAGWGHCLGAKRLPAAEVERVHSLPADTILLRAGIESVARAGDQESELELAAASAQQALLRSRTELAAVDCLVVSTETYLGFPSMGFLLHRRLKLRSDCGVLDVGGACAGLVNALFTASCMLRSHAASTVLVATADVHQHALPPGKVDGRFAGLFGDGASAFLLTSALPTPQHPPFHLGEFTLGCNNDSSNLLTVRLDEQSALQLEFAGDALGRAAVRQLDALLRRLEAQSGCSLASAARFATHQPNPRLLEMLSRQADLPLEKFPVVCKRYGNLGSSTAGVALSLALEECATNPQAPRGPIFVAALGPGLVWGGCVIMLRRDNQ